MTNPVAEAIIENFRIAKEQCTTETEPGDYFYCWPIADYYLGLAYSPDKDPHFSIRIKYRPLWLTVEGKGNDPEQLAAELYWSLFQRIQAIVN